VNQPPELDFCGFCKEHAQFVQSEKGEWRSDCCDALAVPVDVEPVSEWR
jgi:hypothetical protein